MMGRLYWGWVVCASFLILYTLSAGIVFSYSEIMVPLNNEMHSSLTLLSWIGSGPVSLPLLSAPLGTWLYFRFGCQRTVIAGVFITSIALAVTALVDTAGLMFLVYGIICGLGITLIVNPPFFLLDEYFPYHHPSHVLATSIVACAFPLGTLIFNPLTFALMSAFSWRVTYSIFGVATFIVGSATTATFVSKSESVSQINFSEPTEADVIECKKSETGYSEINGVTLTKRTKVFLGTLWMTASTFKSMGYYTPFVTLVKQMDVLDIPQSQAANAMAVIGCCEVVSRLITSYLGDYIKGKILYMYVSCTLVLCILNVLGSFAREFIYLVLYAAGLGLFGGPVIAAMYSSCAEVLGGQHVSELFSVFRVGLGFGALIGPTAAGAIFDTTRSFHMVFYLNAAVYLATCIAYIVIILVNKHKPRCLYPDNIGEEIVLSTCKDSVPDHNKFGSTTKKPPHMDGDGAKVGESLANGTAPSFTSLYESDSYQANAE